MDKKSEQTFDELYELAGFEASKDIVILETLEAAQRGGAVLQATMLGGEPDDIHVYRSID